MSMLFIIIWIIISVALLSLKSQMELLCLISHALVGPSGRYWLRTGIITVEQTKAQRLFLGHTSGPG